MRGNPTGRGNKLVIRHQTPFFLLYEALNPKLSMMNFSDEPGCSSAEEARAGCSQEEDDAARHSGVKSGFSTWKLPTDETDMKDYVNAVLGGKEICRSDDSEPIKFLFSYPALLDIFEGKIARKLLKETTRKFSSLEERVDFEISRNKGDEGPADADAWDLPPVDKAFVNLAGGHPLPLHVLSFVQGFIADRGFKTIYPNQLATKMTLCSRTEICYDCVRFSREVMTLLTTSQIPRKPADIDLSHLEDHREKILSEVLHRLCILNRYMRWAIPKSCRYGYWHYTWLKKMREGTLLLAPPPLRREGGGVQNPVCSPLTMYLLGRMTPFSEMRDPIRKLFQPLFLDHDLEKTIAIYRAYILKEQRNRLNKAFQWRFPESDNGSEIDIYSHGVDPLEVVSIYQLIYSFHPEALHLVKVTEQISKKLISEKSKSFGKAIDIIDEVGGRYKYSEFVGELLESLRDTVIRLAYPLDSSEEELNKKLHIMNEIDDDQYFDEYDPEDSQRVLVTPV